MVYSFPARGAFDDPPPPPPPPPPPLLLSSHPQSSSFLNEELLPERPPMPPPPPRRAGGGAGAVPMGMSEGQVHGRPSAVACTFSLNASAARVLYFIFGSVFLSMPYFCTREEVMEGERGGKGRKCWWNNTGQIIFRHRRSTQTKRKIWKETQKTRSRSVLPLHPAGHAKR